MPARGLKSTGPIEGTRALEEGYFPEEDEHQIPLGVKYDTKPIWAAINETFGVDATGSAMVVAAFEGFFIGRTVSYSRNRNFYGSSRHNLITYNKVIAAVERLAAAGWIYHYKQAPGMRGCQSASPGRLTMTGKRSGRPVDPSLGRPGPSRFRR